MARGSELRLEEGMEVRFCPKCGESRWPDAVFCGSCGFAFDAFEAETRAGEARLSGSKQIDGHLEAPGSEAQVNPGDDGQSRVVAAPLPTTAPVLVYEPSISEVEEPIPVHAAHPAAPAIVPPSEPVARPPIMAAPIPPGVPPVTSQHATATALADDQLDTQIYLASPIVVTPTTWPTTAQAVPVQVLPQVPTTTSGYLPASVPAALEMHRVRRRVGVGFVAVGLALITAGLGMAMFGVPSAATGLTPITQDSTGRQFVDYLPFVTVVILGVVALGAIAAWASDAIDTTPALAMVAAAGLGVVVLAIAASARVGYDTNGDVLPAVSLLVAGGASILSAAVVGALIRE